jgi:signal peptidase I
LISAAVRPSSLFVSLARQLLQDGHAVRFVAQGQSMHPTIRDGDAITIGPVELASLEVGDIVLYQKSHRAMVHRVVAVRAAAPKAVELVTRGDGKAADDAPIGRSDVMGRLVAIEGGKTLAVSARLRRVCHRPSMATVSSFTVRLSQIMCRVIAACRS